MDDIINSLFTASPPVLLMLVLNGIGIALKRTPKMPNWAIPWALIILGGIAYPFVGEWSATVKSARFPTGLMVIYGVGIGLAAVGFYEGLLRKFLPAKETTAPDAPEPPKAP